MKEDTVIKVAEIFADNLGNSSIETVLTILIPAVVTIVGLVLNNKSLKGSFKNELIKQKNLFYLEKIENIPIEALELFENIMDNEISLDDIKKLHKNVFAYGSSVSISIVSNMQREIYEIAGRNGENTNNFKLLCYLLLIVVQTKYDLTEVVVNPEMWFMLKFTDYNDKKDLLAELNNSIVNDLKLNEGFKI